MKYFLVGIACLMVILIVRRIRLANAGQSSTIANTSASVGQDTLEADIAQSRILNEEESSERTVTIEDAVPQITEEELGLVERIAAASADDEDGARMQSIFLAYTQRIAKLMENAKPKDLRFEEYPEPFTLGDGDGVQFEYKACRWLTYNGKEYFVAWKKPEGHTTKGFRAFAPDENSTYPVHMVTDPALLKGIMQQYYWNSVSSEFLVMDEDELWDDVFDETRQTLYLYSDLEDVKGKPCENAGAHQVDDCDDYANCSEYLFLHDKDVPEVFHVFEVVYGRNRSVADIKYVTDRVEYIKAALWYNESFAGIDHINF